VAWPGGVKLSGDLENGVKHQMAIHDVTVTIIAKRKYRQAYVLWRKLTKSYGEKKKKKTTLAKKKKKNKGAAVIIASRL